MAEPFFTVIIPLFDKELSIGRTLDSVLAQSFGDFEVVIVDDGSTDKSPQIVAQRQDSRIRYIRQENAGVSVARNAGLAAAKARYGAFLDADDLWLPDYLQTVRDLIVQCPGAGLYGTGYLISDGRTQAPVRAAAAVASMPPGVVADYFRASLEGEPFCFTSSITVDIPQVLALGGFRPRVRHGEDLDLWARLALATPVAYDPALKVRYRTEGENRAMNRSPDMSPWIFRESVDQAEKTGRLGASDIKTLREYCAKVDLYHARVNLFTPDRPTFRAFVESIATRTLMKKKLIYYALSFVPAGILLAAFNRLRPSLGGER